MKLFSSTSDVVLVSSPRAFLPSVMRCDKTGRQSNVMRLKKLNLGVVSAATFYIISIAFQPLRAVIDADESFDGKFL
jgi:hypothetical protein